MPRKTPAPKALHNSASALGSDWKFRDYGTAADDFGLSPDALAVLAADPSFPVFSKKICPALMCEWLREHQSELREKKVS